MVGPSKGEFVDRRSTSQSYDHHDFMAAVSGDLDKKLGREWRLLNKINILKLGDIRFRPLATQFMSLSSSSLIFLENGQKLKDMM